MRGKKTARTLNAHHGTIKVGLLVFSSVFLQSVVVGLQFFVRESRARFACALENLGGRVVNRQ